MGYDIQFIYEDMKKDLKWALEEARKWAYEMAVNEVVKEAERLQKKHFGDKHG